MSPSAKGFAVTAFLVVAMGAEAKLVDGIPRGLQEIFPPLSLAPRPLLTAHEYCLRQVEKGDRAAGAPNTLDIRNPDLCMGSLRATLAAVCSGIISARARKDEKLEPGAMRECMKRTAFERYNIYFVP